MLILITLIIYMQRKEQLDGGENAQIQLMVADNQLHCQGLP